MKFLILLIFLSSCSPTLKFYNPQYKSPNIIVFRGDADFNREERKIIEDTLIVWEQEIDNVVHLDVIFEKVNEKDWETDGIPTIYKMKKYVSKKLCKGNFIGCGGLISGDIVINYIDDRLPLVIAHEVGHLLLRSAEHSSDPENIMCGIIGNTIKQVEVRKIKEIWRK